MDLKCSSKRLTRHILNCGRKFAEHNLDTISKKDQHHKLLQNNINAYFFKSPLLFNKVKGTFKVQSNGTK